MTGTTKSGFNFEISDYIVEDWDFCEKYERLTSGEKVTMRLGSEVIISAIGADGFEALKTHVREMNGGAARITAIMQEFKEILESVQETKK